jgi:hypothetical protein
MMRRFLLVHEGANKVYGQISFNGKFVFDLDDSIDVDYWNKIGFIKLDNVRHMESNDLFEHLNARLPITLRDKKNEEKLKYIEDTGLKVASDGFYLREVGSS